MRLLIDCYNVLHEPMPPAIAGLDTAQLCLALSRSRWRQQEVIVVCDGAPHALGLTDSPADGVELEYAGHRRKADDIIMDHIQHHHSPRQLLVVTNDREILRAAKARRARTMTSTDFVRQLGNDIDRGIVPTQSGPGRHKIAPELDQNAVDGWLDAFGVDEDALD
jgi:predicted RNA-binding protein with PIN domain